ncbi:MAG: hypothetical protein JSS76_17425 [Bacteroidetes bacterium]|nr:hypothetical protein [Bacteroidota bacterium]
MKDLKDILVLTGLRARLLLVAACLVCYAVSLRNDYSLDDDFAIYANQYVQKGLEGIPDILTHPYYTSSTLTFDYRPVASVTFAVEKQLFGNNPHVGHAVNLALYIIAVLLLLGVLTAVIGLERVPAFITALIFAVHPAHTEVVASIKNREELLSFIFCMLSFFALHRFFDQRKLKDLLLYGLLTIVCLLLSFASKLTSIPVIMIFGAMLWMQGRQRRAKLFYPILALVAIISIGYLVVILRMSNRPVYDLENPLVSYPGDLSAKIGTTAMALLFYFRFMWVPYPFSFFYGYNTIPVEHLGDPVAMLSVMLHLGLFIYGLILFFRKNLTGLLILSYFFAIALYSNILIPYTGIVSERALFFPSVWFIAAFVHWLYERLSAKKASATLRYVALSFLAIMITGYGTLDIVRVHQWHDTLSLMSSDIPHLNNSTLANYFYGCVLKNTAEVQPDTSGYRRYMRPAKEAFYRVNSLSPTYPYGYFRLGLIYRYDEYNGDSAFYYFNKAYEYNKEQTDIRYQYGRTQYEFGDMHRAADVFAALYKEIPTDTFTVFYHALLQLKLRNMQEGKRAADEFMSMAPNYYQAHFNMGIYYELSGDADNAAREYQRSVDLGCTDQLVYNYLIDYYATHGREQEADRFRRLRQ